MILLIKYKVDWELIRQKNQTQTNKDNICQNNKRVDHDYKVGDKVVLTNNSAYKYETTYNGPFLKTQYWTNGTVTLQCGPIKLGIIYVVLMHLNMIQTLNILKFKICMMIVNIWSPVIYFCITLKLGIKVYNIIRTETLKLIHIGHAREFFRYDVIFFTRALPYITR